MDLFLPTNEAENSEATTSRVLAKPVDYSQVLGKHSYEIEFKGNLQLPHYADVEATLELMTVQSAFFEILYSKVAVYKMLKRGKFPKVLRYLFLPDDIRKKRGKNTEKEISTHFPADAAEQLLEFCVIHPASNFGDFDVEKFLRPPKVKAVILRSPMELMIQGLHQREERQQRYAAIEEKGFDDTSALDYFK